MQNSRLQATCNPDTPPASSLRQARTAVGTALLTAASASKDNFEQVMQQEVVRLCNLEVPTGVDVGIIVEDLLHYGAENALRRAGIILTRPESPPAGAPDICELLPRVLSVEEQQVAEDHAAAVEGLATGGGYPMAAKVPVFKFQLFQMYRASVNLGYVLRFTSRRLAAANALGSLDGPKGQSGGGSDDADRMTVSKYFNTYATDPVMEFVRCGTVEAAHVLRDLQEEVFGDQDALMKQLQEVVGQVESAAEYRAKVAAAAAAGTLAPLDLTVGDIRRIVLEAVAFGASLQETEVAVELSASRRLLSPMMRL